MLRHLSSECNSISGQTGLGKYFVKYFSENGYALIRRIKDADLILINSCGYRNEDEKFTKDTIENVLKKSKSASKVVSVGCLNKINGQVLKDISNEILLVDNFQEFDSLIKAEKLFNTFKGRGCGPSIRASTGCWDDPVPKPARSKSPYPTENTG